MIFSLAPQIQPHDIYERGPSVQWQKIEGAVILIDPRESKAIHFNELGTKIWEELDGKKNVEGIIQNLRKIYAAEEKLIRKDSLKFLKRLLELELISKAGIST